MFRHILSLLFICFIFSGCLGSKPKPLDFTDRRQAAPSKGEEDAGFINPAHFRLRAGDRIFVSNFMKSIFHANAGPVIDWLITRNQSTFGGICDLADDVNTCYFQEDNVVIAPSGTVKAGAVTKACEHIMADTNNLNTALAHNGLTSADIIDEANLTLQYKLFYPFKQPPQAFLDNLLTYEAALGNRTEAWRNIHLTLCVSPEWQIP